MLSMLTLCYFSCFTVQNSATLQHTDTDLAALDLYRAWILPCACLLCNWPPHALQEGQLVPQLLTQRQLGSCLFPVFIFFWIVGHSK